MKRILIYGSCVSRDAFEFSEGTQFSIVDYYARSSLASAFTPYIPIPDMELQNMSSSWRKRTVQRDMKKSFSVELPTLDYDILLLDMIDERFRLWQSPAGALMTLSTDAVKSGYNFSASGGIIGAMSDKKMQLWTEGWRKFMAMLKLLNVDHKLRVNKTYWSKRVSSGNKFIHTDDGLIDKSNKILEKMYDIMKKDVPPENFIVYPNNVIVGSENHKWGEEPFHYIDAFYHHTLDSLGINIRR